MTSVVIALDSRTPDTRIMVRSFLLTGVAIAVLLVNNFAMAWSHKGAEVISQQTFCYGAFEARIRTAKGQGFVTPFFLWKDGSHLPGALWQEMNFEFFGDERSRSFQTQIMTPGSNAQNRTEHNIYHCLPTNPWEAFYTYRMEWTEQHIAFFIDGVEVRRETNAGEYEKHMDRLDSDGDGVFAECAQLRVGLWGSGIPWGSIFDPADVPSATFVDYVRVYPYDPVTRTISPNPSVINDDFNSFNTSRWFKANWTFDSAVTDYVPENAGTRNGYLVVALTDTANVGQLPLPPSDTQPSVPSNFGFCSNAPIPLELAEYPNAPAAPTVPAWFEAELPSRYADGTSGNAGDAQCAVVDLDAQFTTDVGGGCAVAFTTPGEILEYDFVVDEPGDYDLWIRAATAIANVAIRLEVDGVPVGNVALGNYGWQSYRDYQLLATPFTIGQHTLRVVFVTGRANLNHLEISFSDYDGGVDPDPLFAVPGRIQAETPSRFSDTTPNNQGDATCGQSGVDAQASSDVGGGCNVAFTRAGETLDYDIQVSNPGTYSIGLRWATGAATAGGLMLSVDGALISGGYVRPSNLGWQKYQDSTRFEAFLSAGVHTLRVDFGASGGGVNLNHIDVGFLGSGEEEPEPSPLVAVPARLEAELPTAFVDTTPGNQGDARCGITALDVQATATASGGCVVAYTRSGESLDFAFEVVEAAAYTISWRWASGSTTVVGMRVFVDGLELTRGPTKPPTLGWGSYADYVLAPVRMEVGEHLLRVDFGTTGGQINLDYLDIELGTMPDEETTENIDTYDVEGSATSVDSETLLATAAPTTEPAGTTSTDALSSQPVQQGVVEAALAVFNDWGSGYCATLRVWNDAGLDGWLVRVSTPSARISDSWNLVRSQANAGIYDIGPVAFNATAPPGSLVEAGFCANRLSGNLQPFVVSAGAH